MKEIKISFEHQKLVLESEGQEWFINAFDILTLLDRQRVHEIFHSLKPEVVYADLDGFDQVAIYEAMKAKDYSNEKIAERLNVSEGLLEGWLIDRAGFIEKIKADKADDLKAYVSRLKTEL